MNSDLAAFSSALTWLSFVRSNIHSPLPVMLSENFVLIFVFFVR